MSRASYSRGVVDGIIWVQDEGVDEMSVTNDAEQVVSEVVGRHGDRLVIYRDSDRIWDQLVHEHGVFKTFAPLRKDNLADAIAAMNTKYGRRG